MSGSLAIAAADVVIASDVLFDPADWDALIHSLIALAAPRVILAHRLRNKQEQQFFTNSRLLAHFTVIRCSMCIHSSRMSSCTR